MEIIRLDIIPGKTAPVVHASQYDVGRTIGVYLLEGSSVYTLTGAETVTASIRKPDGNVVVLNVANTSSDYVEIVTTEQATACDGANLCELKIEDGGDVIGTANFIMSVEKDPLEGGIASASEIDNLATQIAGMVATEVANQYDSANVIFDNTPTPGHGNGYAVTSEGVKNAIDGIGTPTASSVSYDNTVSGLTATNVQDAIDEVNGKGLEDLSDTTITTPSSGQVLSYDGGKWKNNALLVSKEGVGTLTAVNDTVQIPNDVLAKSIIIIVLRRYGYFGTITVSKSQLSQGAYSAGTQLYGDNNNSWKINISNSGVITLVAISGTAFPNVDCYGLF